MNDVFTILVCNNEFFCKKSYIFEISSVIRTKCDMKSNIFDMVKIEENSNELTKSQIIYEHKYEFQNIINGNNIDIRLDLFEFIKILTNDLKINLFYNKLEDLYHHFLQLVLCNDSIINKIGFYENIVFRYIYTFLKCNCNRSNDPNIVDEMNINISEFLDNESLQLMNLKSIISKDNYCIFAKILFSLCLLAPNLIENIINMIQNLDNNDIHLLDEIKCITTNHFFIKNILNLRKVKKITRLMILNFFSSFSNYYSNEYITKILTKSENTFLCNEIYIALRDDNLDFIQQIIASNINFDIDMKFDNVYPLICIAAYFSSLNCFKYLIINNAQIPSNLLNYAIAGGNIEIIHLCQQKQCIFSNKSLLIANIFHHENLISWLIENNYVQNDRNIMEIFLFSNFNSLKIIIENVYKKFSFSELFEKSEINVIYNPFNFINLLLILSSACNHFEVLQWILLLPGININTSSQLFHKYIDICNHGSPLYYACLNKNIKMVQSLVKYPKINLNMKSTNDLPPLSIVCKSGSNQIAEILLNCNSIDVNCASYSKEKLYPLHFACIYGHIEIVKLLLQKKEIEINCKTYDII